MAAAASICEDFYKRGLQLSARGQHLLAIEAFEQALAANTQDTRVLFALGNTARMRRAEGGDPGDLTPQAYLEGLQKVFDGELAAGKVITPFEPVPGA